MSKILIVDDNPQNLYLARFLLENSGHSVHEAFNGQEAVDFCSDNDIELVLMDVQMPIMDGLTATGIIKSEINRHLKIVALTARAMDGDKEEILSAGCDGYIKKPISPDTFVELVEIYLT